MENILNAYSYRPINNILIVHLYVRKVYVIMKALICTEPRKLEYASVKYPQLQPGKAIIKIKRIGVCGTDLHAFEGTQPFFEYPRILGHELSGELIDAGNAPGFELGEAVTFLPYYNCGNCIACRMGKTNCCMFLKVCGVHTDGGMVEYLSIPSTSLMHGRGLSYEQLALVEPLAIGAHGIRRATIQPNEFVLVVGAGPIGLATIAFAKIAGARVIALDTNLDRLQFCKNKMHVEFIIDARANDVSQQIADITNGDMPMVVVDATGNLQAIKRSFSYMAHGGRYILIGLQKEDISFNHPEFHKREGTLMSSRNATRKDFEQVISCIRNGTMDPSNFITHKVEFGKVKEEFESWLHPANGVIKAMAVLE